MAGIESKQLAIDYSTATPVSSEPLPLGTFKSVKKAPKLLHVCIIILKECKALWGSPDRVVDMNLMAHGPCTLLLRPNAVHLN